MEIINDQNNNPRSRQRRRREQDKMILQTAMLLNTDPQKRYDNENVKG